jgi:hypothetical protein
MTFTDTDHPVTAPAPGNTLCNFTVAAMAHCPEIIAAAHALYYWRHREGIKEFEIENARKAMRKLNEAFAAVETLFEPEAPHLPPGEDDVPHEAAILQREHQADYDEERSEGWAAE